VLNEAARLGGALAALATQRDVAEVIVVDGGSHDGTLAIARGHPDVRTVVSRCGRGRQLNAGAAAATGDTLLFLHADVTLPRDAALRVRAALADPAVVGGAFRTQTVAAPSARWWIRSAMRIADVRSRYARTPYGDQAMFVRAAAFHQAGGYPAQPLMEDLELSRRLRAIGRVRVVSACVVVSGRRFEARPMRTALCWNLFPLLYAAGVSPVTLARVYGNPR